MSGSRAIPAKDRKIRSTLWVPPAKRRVPPIGELGLASAYASLASWKRKKTIANEDSYQNAPDAGMQMWSLDDTDDDDDVLLNLLLDEFTVQPEFQNNTRLNVLRA